MDIDRAFTEVEIYEALFELANTTNCTFKHFLDKDSFLWVYNLVIAFFKLAIDLDVLDVEHGVVRELFFQSPIFDILLFKLKAEAANTEALSLNSY